MNKESKNIGKRQTAVNAGFFVTGAYGIKVAFTEAKREWQRSRNVLNKIKPDFKESYLADKSLAFPEIGEEKKAVILKRITMYFYLYLFLLCCVPISIWQAVSHNIYSPIIGSIGFLLIAVAKLVEYSFTSYQIRRGRFVKFNEWVDTPKEWLPKGK